MVDFVDYTLAVVCAGAAILGVVSGALGTFAVLRRQSLLGDAMSHAALPGVALAFMLSHSKTPLVLLLGAAVAGWIGTLVVMAVVNTTRLKHDTALGILLSVFFGFGIVLLSYIKNHFGANQAGLERFLFGQAAALTADDVITMALIGIVALAVLLLAWKEFKLLSFDAAFGASLGLPMRAADIALTTLLVTAIVIGLQTVGVVLMSAMIVAPAAAARQWTDRLGRMVLLASVFGAVSGVGGTLMSASVLDVPTGPTIVLCATLIVVASLMVAHNRGIVWSWLRHRRNQFELRLDSVLIDLYELAQQHENPAHAHATGVLRTMSAGHAGVEHSLKVLRQRGLVWEMAPNSWALTPAGTAAARSLVNDVLALDSAITSSSPSRPPLPQPPRPT